jgi:hypothetical protein
MWLRNPAGPYEPMTFLALLFGGTIVELVRRFQPDGPAEAPRPPQSDAPRTSEQLNRGESSTKPAHGDARPSALRVQEGSLDLGALVNREIRVVYTEPFSVRPHASGFTVVSLHSRPLERMQRPFSPNFLLTLISRAHLKATLLQFRLVKSSRCRHRAILQ